MLKIRGFIEGEDEEVWIRIQNEAYREHFNFRPRTIEETEYWITNKPWCDILGLYKKVGFKVAYKDWIYLRKID